MLVILPLLLLVPTLLLLLLLTLPVAVSPAGPAGGQAGSGTHASGARV